MTDSPFVIIDDAASCDSELVCLKRGARRVRWSLEKLVICTRHTLTS